MARAMSFPDKQTVLDFLKEHPDATTKQDIARGLKVKGRERQTLRAILKELEADGTLTRTGRREWAQSDMPPPTCVVRFERTDENGELIARAFGKDGAYVDGTDLGLLKNLNGSQSYIVPASLNIDHFNELYIWCLKFAVPLAVAELN